MQQKNSVILIISLVIVAVITTAIAVSAFRTLKKTGLEFNEKKAILVKENLDLKDKLDSLQEMINQKTESLNVFEKDKKTLEEQLNLLKKENEKLMASTTEEIDSLKKKQTILKKKIVELESSPAATRIKEAIEKEDNDKIKKVLEDSLNKIELIKEGKSINLEPILITKKEGALTAQGPVPQEESTASPVVPSGAKQGVILSLDRKNNLMVINLGRKDDIKEGSKCKILKDGQDVAEGEVISARYRISAVFINNIQYKYTINDIKEGYKVSAGEE